MGHRKRAPGIQVLLRKIWLHRNLPFGDLAWHGEYFSLSQKEFNAERIAAAEEAGGSYTVRSLAMYKHRLARSLAVLVNN